MPGIACDGIHIYADQFPPYNYQDDHGVSRGLSVKIMTELLLRANLADCRVNFLPWARAYRDATEHPNILLMTLTRTAERESAFYWFGPVVLMETRLYALAKRTDIVISSDADLLHYRFGVKNSAIDHALLLKKGVAKEHVETVKDDVDNIRKLLLGRVDMTPMSAQEILYYARILHKPVSMFRPVIALRAMDPLYFALSKKSSPELYEKITKAFNDMDADGTLAAIQKVEE